MDSSRARTTSCTLQNFAIKALMLPPPNGIFGPISLLQLVKYAQANKDIAPLP